MLVHYFELIILLVTGGGLGFELITKKISNSITTPVNKILYATVFSVMFVIATMVSINGLLEVFGFSHRINVGIFLRDNKTQNPNSNIDQSVDAFTQLGLPEKCRLALNNDFSDWTLKENYRKYVYELKSLGKTVDDCRLEFAIPSLDKIKELRDISIIAQLDEKEICRRILTRDSSQFDWTLANESEFKEAKRRGYTSVSCREALGFIKSARAGESTVEVKLPSYNKNEPIKEIIQWNTGRISNSRSSYSYVRAEANKFANQRGKVYNGQIVYLLGVRMSNTNHEWCRIATNSGLEGYILAEYVVGDCYLTEAQDNALRQAERNRQVDGVNATISLLMLIGIVAGQ